FSTATGRLELSYSGDHPSYLFARLQAMFPNVKQTTDAERPFAADAVQAAAIVCRQSANEKPKEVADCVDELLSRREYRFTPLDEDTVKSLYGERITLSASRIDRFASCKYAYFMQYGLKAQPWKQAKFDAPIFGTFVHWVLEHTVHEIRTGCGFDAVTDAQVAELTAKYIREYTETFMPDLDDRGERFAYLYQRNFDEVRSVAEDVIRELRSSKFVPVDEELSFSFDDDGLQPVRIDGKKASCNVIGYVDRVDLYERDGQYYCRVVDYKTGRKDLDYAEILCGQGLQMLIYLFTLEKFGAERYGKPILPAGVMYVPARTDMQAMEPGSDVQQLYEARMKNRRRKGLVLHDESILLAMEDAEQPQYLPCKKKKDGYSGDLADGEQMRKLGRFVTQAVADMTDEIASGTVMPDPIIRGPMHSACQYCDFAQVCHMDLGHHQIRNIKSVKPDHFWNEVDRRLEHE
ncbi:MAG: PD-(D/E)XK nuclease family protein, partial [Oscillospiraceae bacterium]|nr:PD-(D/E)XK nuclease family protein [Oscillospiraceae bacterium]